MSQEHPSFSKFFKYLWNKFTGRYVHSFFRIPLQLNMISAHIRVNSNQPPWNENWKLDERFFRDMERWKEEHPESTFIRVMKKVDDAVQADKSFMDCIPDAPFPARSLVKGLAFLLRLGVVCIILFLSCIILTSISKTISRTRKEVFDFTNQIITWLVTIEASFGKENGKFTAHARKNLKLIR